MADSHEDGRVAVYLDFDNIVMSWYDRVHGRNAYSKDRARIAENPSDPEIAARLADARVDVGAIIDFAASSGTLVLTRAYADWSSPVNALYRQQLVGRAVDLVQLFPAAAYAKNGADIRLAVDAVEDMFRLPDLTHVVIVAGDSDYVPLAQRCRRLGRYVIGVGVAGSTAKSLAAACDEFEAYDALPGVQPPKPAQAKTAKKDEPVADETPKRRSRRTKADEKKDEYVSFGDTPPEDLHAAATKLLERALQAGQSKSDEAGWLHGSAVKQHIRRMDPTFSEKALGYRSFSDFLASREGVAEFEERGNERLVRLKE